MGLSLKGPITPWKGSWAQKLQEERNMYSNLLDDLCKKKIEMDIDTSVSWFLMGSYGYYRRDNPILTDGTYDWLAKHIAKHWDEIKHPYKALLDKESLEITSSFELQEENYPASVRDSYVSLVERYLKPRSA